MLFTVRKYSAHFWIGTFLKNVVQLSSYEGIKSRNGLIFSRS